MFQVKPDSCLNIKFYCKLCNKVLLAPYSYTTNLNKHLKTHDILDIWFERYRDKSKMLASFHIDDNIFALVKYFLRSNSSLNELRDEDLNYLLNKTIKMPTYNFFRNIILPNILQKVFSLIENKLNESVSINLMTDIWTNKRNQDFIALVASVSLHYSREIFVIGMMPMNGNHNANNIKICIEKMLNRYKFNRSKINGK